MLLHITKQNGRSVSQCPSYQHYFHASTTIVNLSCCLPGKISSRISETRDTNTFHLTLKLPTHYFEHRQQPMETHPAQQA
jgi:hypothetical protein